MSFHPQRESFETPQRVESDLSIRTFDDNPDNYGFSSDESEDLPDFVNEEVPRDFSASSSPSSNRFQLIFLQQSFFDRVLSSTNFIKKTFFLQLIIIPKCVHFLTFINFIIIKIMFFITKKMFHFQSGLSFFKCKTNKNEPVQAKAVKSFSRKDFPYYQFLGQGLVQSKKFTISYCSAKPRSPQGPFK